MTTAPLVVGTRERLLDEAERLFAIGGVQGVTTREIVEAAQQRNPSAVTYHFGSRRNLLLQILARRGAPVDDARGVLRARAGEDPDVAALVACLVLPYTALLESEAGRAYVRIVAQLRGQFAAWRVQSDAATTQHLARILDGIESAMRGPSAVRGERLVALIMLLTGTVAERARRIDDGTGNELDDEAFVANLSAMCVALASI